MTPTETAAALGTEHGTRDAETWLDHELHAPGLSLSLEQIVAHVEAGRAQQWRDWPKPDLDAYTPPSFKAWGAYCDAFVAAVEATVTRHAEATR